MRRHFFEASLFALLVASTPALAEPATGDGAKAIAQGFAAYFGRSAIDQGIIAVTPQGEDYKVAVDLQHVIDGLGIPAGSVKLAPFSFLTTPQQGGTWKVAATSFPSIGLSFSTPEGQYGGTVALNGYKFSGVYDPKLASFITANNTIDLIDVKWTAKDTEVTLQESGSVTDFQGSDAGGGAVTGKLRHTVKSLVETVKVTPAAGKSGSPPAMPVNISYKIGGMTTDGTLDTMRSRSMLDLWAYLVSLQGPEHVVEHQDDVKSRLLAILPLWKSTKVNLALNGVSAELPFGSVGMKTLTEKVSLSGEITRVSPAVSRMVPV